MAEIFIATCWWLMFVTATGGFDEIGQDESAGQADSKVTAVSYQQEK